MSRRIVVRILISSLFLIGIASAQGGTELRFCLRSEPKTFDPLKVDDDSSLTLRYLTGGVLGSQYQDVFAFIVLILVLLVRPAGIGKIGLKRPIGSSVPATIPRQSSFVHAKRPP